jgi:hypothetical protein
MDRLQLDDLVPPSRLGADIPPTAEAALLKALAVRAENRFQSIAELRAGIVPPVVNKPPAVVTPLATEPSSISSSKVIFLPVFAVLVLLILVWANIPSMRTIFLLSEVALFAAMLALFFSMWSAVQDGHARMSPGKALGLMLIPVFNLYWVFPVIGGFAKDYNSFIDRNTIKAEKLSRPLFLSCSVSLVIYWVFAGLGGIATTVVLLIHACFFFPMLLNVCDGVDTVKSMGVIEAQADDVIPQLEGKDRLVATGLSLHCIAGEYKGVRIEIGGREIVIGRNPTLANLVLSSGEVSAKHVRIWRDRVQSGAWVEDLHSTNGTFYRESGSSGNAWIRLSGSKLLTVGDRFRVSSDVAEFEVAAS